MARNSSLIKLHDHDNYNILHYKSNVIYYLFGLNIRRKCYGNIH